MLPEISIIIPCFNYGQYIEEAIKSVELYPDPSVYEIIIINDGSTDPKTIQVLKELEEKGYHVINQENQGLGASRNNGIRVARGKYILPLDADNKVRPEYLEEGLKIMEQHPGIGVVYGNSQKFGEEEGLGLVPPFDVLSLVKANYIDACAVYRKEVWKSVGGYFTDMPVMGLEDWMFWLQAIKRGWDFYYVDKVLFDYRVRKGSMITKTYNNSLSLRLHLYVLEKQIEVLTSIQNKRVDTAERKSLLLKLKKEYSLLAIYDRGILRLMPEVIKLLITGKQPITYLKDSLYWYKRRLRNENIG